MIKYSKQRELILKAVQDNQVHPTADFVYNKLKEENPGLSLGTVYRNLNLLAEDRQIRKLKMAEGPDRFDGTLHPHYHMLCNQCKELVDVETEAFEGMEEKISEETGCRINRIEVIFEGICAACLKGCSS